MGTHVRLPEMERERSWVFATRIAVWVVGALFVVLLGTGIALAFRYRPDVSYANAPGVGHASLFTARHVHRLASLLFVPAVGALAISSGGLFLVRRTRPAIALTVGAAVVVPVAAITGLMLPWDQLALRAVTVGTNLQGYGPILSGDRVKFVLIGNHELGTADFSRWFWLHSAAVPVVFAAIVIALVLAARRTPTPTS